MCTTCGYEFTYLRNVLNFKSVFARKSRKVMKAILEDFNIEFRCSLYLSQVKLERLPSVYQLDCQKQVGLLDYNLPRSPITELSENELKYCEYDCLVLYEYIKLMKAKFGTVKSIPLTSTGIVRRELKEELAKDKKYKYVVRNCLNTEGEIYDVLVSSFYGGYTHANFLYTGDIIKNVTSYDFCSSYPFVLCTEKYPLSKFRKCKIDNHTQFSSRFCYIVDVTFYGIDSKYFNNIISKSSCYSGDKIQTDNGRIIKAKEISTIITDIDFELIRKAYKYDYYIINECYYARKDYLPKTIAQFILKKYVDKTKLKNVEGKEVLYQITKGSFNAIYGMCCTNNIRDQVTFDNTTGWSEEDLSPTQIEKLLIKEKMFPFLSFAWGSFCTAYARRNLLENLLKLDEYCLYCDTDSLKLKEGYDKSIIDEYNKKVIEKIKKVCQDRDISFDSFSPKDIKGREHTLGLFENETEKGRQFTYDEFITQGAKKYAYKIDDKINITVSGVPKSGAKALKSLEEFTDNFIFKYEDTGKNMILYNDNQIEHYFRDYQGNFYKASYQYGSCILPTTYELGKSQDYQNLLSDESSKRAIYRKRRNTWTEKT